jgi:hypothetical protein
MVEPVTGSARWTRVGTSEDAFSAIEAYAKGQKARIKKSGNQITLFFGNRLAHRFIGSSAGRVPYTVRVSIIPESGPRTHLAAEAYSDPGPLIVGRTETGTRTYEALISETLDALQQQ